MLVDSFDKRNYAPERHLETKVAEQKVDADHRSFKSILYKNSSVDTTKPVAKVNGLDGIELQKATRSSDLVSSSNYKVDSSGSKKVHIGTLSDDTPTVSELLYNTKYKKHCWEMLEKDVNSSKPFKNIPAGTDIFLDKATSEIVWGKKDNDNRKDLTAPSHYKSKSTFYKSESGFSSSVPALSNSVNPYSVSSSYKSETMYSIGNVEPHSKSSEESRKSKVGLHEAVREFMGKDYSKIDCYELVVNGLKNMGVKYSGRDGLGKHLIDKAVGEGLRENHYLTGEGLVQATGQSVYNKRVLSVNNPIYQAKSAMNEMENVLKEGQILSFSTRTRGHTGVVGKKNGVWTFINSGYMDNNIAGKNGKKQVGEEILAKELENWFKLAGKKRDGLMITLGDIDVIKLASFQNYKNSLSEKV